VRFKLGRFHARHAQNPKVADNRRVKSPAVQRAQYPRRAREHTVGMPVRKVKHRPHAAQAAEPDRAYGAFKPDTLCLNVRPFGRHDKQNFGYPASYSGLDFPNIRHGKL
jgi:hypothetical protein